MSQAVFVKSEPQAWSYRNGRFTSFFSGQIWDEECERAAPGRCERPHEVLLQQLHRRPQAGMFTSTTSGSCSASSYPLVVRSSGVVQGLGVRIDNCGFFPGLPCLSSPPPLQTENETPSLALIERTSKAILHAHFGHARHACLQFCNLHSSRSMILIFYNLSSESQPF